MRTMVPCPGVQSDVPSQDEVMHELADVVLVATVVAEHHGFTLEEAIRAKIELDTGHESFRAQPLA